ncbi:MAG: hypothetical protein KAU52_05450, partial [Methanosarcinales archaeon]|nr:hypothetical protein [Methanosarcinales archaeon]
LWEAISQNGKVVAVFFGDEHNYNRMSVDSETPVYLDGSTNPNFTSPVWQIITGGAGAPFYAQQETPWSGDVESFYPSKHYCMISVDGGEVSLKAISDSGEVVDECVLRDGAPAGDASTTELSAEVVPAISITVETTALDFGTVGAGLSSDAWQIRIANTGTHNVSVTAEIGADESGFYEGALRLNGGSVDGLSVGIPADITDFEHAEDVAASLEVPEWAGGEYDGTVLFVAEGI